MKKGECMIYRNIRSHLSKRLMSTIVELWIVGLEAVEDLKDRDLKKCYIGFHSLEFLNSNELQ